MSDLVVHNGAALAQFDPRDLLPFGMDTLEQGDTGMPPRLRISQPNRPIETAEGETQPGQIVNSLTGEALNSLDVVVLGFLPKTRVMWPEGFDASNQPMCASDDGKMPSQSSDVRTLTDPKEGPCADCPFAQFLEDGTPPACKAQRNFLVWLVEQGEPAILTLQSTALKAARQLTTLARTQGLRKAIHFATQKVKDDRGGWFVPVFAKGAALDNEKLSAVVEARQELQNLVITADIAEEMREAVPESEPVESGEPNDIPF